jgi:hypothetical protein
MLTIVPGRVIRAVKRANHRFMSILALCFLNKENRLIIIYLECLPTFDKD